MLLSNYIYIYKSFKPKPKLETQNYFNNLQRRKSYNSFKRKITPINTLVLTDTLPTQNTLFSSKPRKKLLTEQYEQRIHQIKPHSIRAIKCKANNDTISNIFKSNTNTNTNVNIRPQKKVILSTPSLEYTKMLDKKALLHARSHIKTTNNEPNTFNRIIFGNNTTTTNNNNTHLINHSNSNNAMIKYNKQQSSIGDILMYDNTPKGYDIQTIKPTQMRYSTLVDVISHRQSNSKYNGSSINVINNNTSK
jgi:hypothetical protein